MKYDFEDGKYTVSFDNGNLTALRNGEPWGRDLVGDKLVYAMLAEVTRLAALNAELSEKLVDTEADLQSRRVQLNFDRDIIDGLKTQLAEATRQADLIGSACDKIRVNTSREIRGYLQLLAEARSMADATEVSRGVLHQSLRDIAEDFQEINLANFGEQEVSSLNNWGIEMVTAIRALDQPST